MFDRKVAAKVFFALVCALIPAVGNGQPFSAGRYVLSGGGASVDSEFSTSGTIGQADATPSVLIGGTFLEFSGYWTLENSSNGPGLNGGQPAAPALTWTNPAPISYGTALGPEQLNALANVAGNFAYSPSNGAVLNAGTNTLSVIFTATNGSAQTNVSLVVLPATLTVTASNATRFLGATNPVFTDSITGLTNGDDITVTNICAATSSSPPGAYPIVPTLVDPNDRQTNYIVSLVPGTLTVLNNPAAPSIITLLNNQAVIAVTSPANNFLTTNAQITVKGTVKGVGGNPPVFTSLQVTANNNAPTNATLLTAGTWSCPLTLVPGANVFTIQSVDTNGLVVNLSFPVTRTFFYDATAPSRLNKAAVTLLTSPPGSGKIIGESHNAVLEIGKLFNIKAVPNGNWVFTNWSSGTNTNSLSPIPGGAALTFDMSSNLILQANFAANPFTNAVAGVYNGLFSSAAGVSEASSGYLTASLPTAGHPAYSAKLLLAGNAYSFSGAFDLSGNAHAALASTGKDPLTVDLHLNLYPPDDQITGYVVSSVSNGWVSGLMTDRAVFNAKSNPDTNYDGRYTLIIPPGSNAPASEPGGYGYATLVNTPAGVVTISGSLADKTPVSESTTISKDGYIPFYSALYSKKGLLWGWLSLTNATAGADLAWIKTNIPKTLYPAGFTNTNVTVIGSLYASNFTLTNATLTVSNGDLAGAIVFTNLTFENGKLITNGSPTNKLKGIITPATGVLTVTFQPTGARTPITAKGVVLQDTNLSTNAAGWFSGTNQSGFFLLQP